MKLNKKITGEGERIAALATWVVFVLMIIKGGAGLVLGSIALVADAIHSFADIFASLVVYLGLRVAKNHPQNVFPLVTTRLRAYPCFWCPLSYYLWNSNFISSLQNY